MAYIDGFVLAVPTANKQQFIVHANKGDRVFLDHGATRVASAGATTSRGQETDFQARRRGAG